MTTFSGDHVGFKPQDMIKPGNNGIFSPALGIHVKMINNIQPLESH